MNKLLTKTVKKVTLLSIVLAVVVVLSIVVNAIFGVNYAATLSDCNSLTITVNSRTYEDKLDEIESICEKEFEAKGLDYDLVKYGEMSGDDNEIVYEFDKDAKLTEAKKALETAFAAKTQDGGEWDGSFITVSEGSEALQTTIPTSYVVRAAVAVAVFAVLAFVYVALRFRLNMGIAVAVSSVVGSVVTAALVLLVRIPVTNSIVYVAALAAPVTAVLVLLTMAKLRTALKEKTDEAAEETIVKNVAVKETLAIAAVGGVALVLVGAIATATVRWFAITALLGLLTSVCVGLVFAPALYLPLKKAADKKAATSPKNGYVGAKKKEDAETQE